MKKQLHVVIGANFGDEGKGLFTDYLANVYKENAIVVMNNGGSQRAHCVTVGDTRHIFNHFGSGTLAGVPTYISEYYMVNPMKFVEELDELIEIKETIKSVNLDIYVSPRSLVTTPYDMLINELLETSRGKARHGSCGLGINETVIRNKTEYSLRVYELMDLTTTRDTLDRIRKEYVPKRLKELGIEQGDCKKYFESDTLLENFMTDIKDMLSNIMIKEDDMLDRYKNWIIENAQGLLLDQNSEYFPHVTRSNTGIKNVVDFLQKMKLTKEDVVVNVNYITRAYRTRHGAGPMKYEVNDRLLYPKVSDITNLYGKYQGSIRFGYLDVDELVENINKDFAEINGKYVANKHLVVTCMDQLEDTVDYVLNGEMQSIETSKYTKLLKEVTGANCVLESHGPTRETVKRGE